MRILKCTPFYDLELCYICEIILVYVLSKYIFILHMLHTLNKCQRKQYWIKQGSCPWETQGLMKHKYQQVDILQYHMVHSILAMWRKEQLAGKCKERVSWGGCVWKMSKEFPR